MTGSKPSPFPRCCADLPGMAGCPRLSITRLVIYRAKEAERYGIK